MSYQEPPEAKNVSPQGTAGRDVIQVGGNYLRFIQVNLDAGNWGVILSHCLLFLLIISGVGFGTKSVINYFQQHTVINDPPDPPTATPSLAPEPNPFESVEFPQAACGDPLPLNKDQYPLSLYPVFISDSDENLNRVKTEFCQDAIRKRRESTGKQMIQVASFLSVERANQFKDFMISKFGSGEVGEASNIAEIPSSLAARAEEEERNQSGFQKVLINCRTSPSAQIMDLEFSGCQLRYGQLVAPLKNYSGSWYEVELQDGSAGLISPSMEDALPLNPEGYNAVFETNCMIAPNDSQCANKPPLQESVWVKQYPDNPSRRIEVACDDSPREIWGLKMTPRCNSGGIYIDIESGVQHPIELTLGNGNSNIYEPSLGGSTGYVTSDSRTVSFTLSVR